MSVSWDKIQDALAAAIRGDERPPVVSQRTLFGIPSTVEVQMAKFAAELAHQRANELHASEEGEAGDASLREEASPYETELRRRVRAVAVEAGERVLIGRGMRYFIRAGREAGFDIPAYPFDPKGELKDFLRERGARNLPEYYATLGIPIERYEDVQTHAMLVIKPEDAEGRERGVLLRGAEYCEASRYLPLAESGYIQMCSLSALESLACELNVELPKGFEEDTADDSLSAEREDDR